MTAAPAPPPAPAPCPECGMVHSPRPHLTTSSTATPVEAREIWSLGDRPDLAAAPARPEAATPDPVTATIGALLEAAKGKDHASRAIIGVNRAQLEGEAIGLDAAAALVRERLAPQWDALAARLAEAEQQLAATQAATADYEQLAADRDRVLDLNDRLEAENTTIADWLSDAKAALRDIKDAYPPGHHGHDTAHAALDKIGGGEHG